MSRGHRRAGGKVRSALAMREHMLVVDVLLPGPNDPVGFPGALSAMVPSEPLSMPEPFSLPSGEPLTVMAYMAGATADAALGASLEHLSAWANCQPARAPGTRPRRGDTAGGNLSFGHRGAAQLLA